MKNLIIKNGLIIGAIATIPMMIMAASTSNGKINFESGMMIGFAAMFLGYAIMIYQIKKFHQSSGPLKFVQALIAGAGIILIASCIYVLAWEIIYHFFIPNFGDIYAQEMIDGAIKKGIGEDELSKMTSEMEQFKMKYKNPLYNIGMTFLEILPIGLGVALLNALFYLKKKA
jgi:hypothetical protein